MHEFMKSLLVSCQLDEQLDETVGGVFFVFKEIAANSPPKGEDTTEREGIREGSFGTFAERREG